MKVIYLFVCLFITSSVAAQSTSDVYREANPDQTYVEENSPYTDIYRQMIAAKKQGNAVLHNNLLHQLTTQFPNRFTGSEINSQEMPSAVYQKNFTPPFQTDWGTTDYTVNAGLSYTPPANNTKAGLDIEADSMGNKYICYITDDRNLLIVRKSTDQGVTWPILVSINPGGATKWHSFDMFITDSTNGTFKIGIAGCRTQTVGSNDGDLYFLSYDQNGGSQKVVSIQAAITGFGHINPSIVSDGWEYSPGLTYWYVAFQRYNTTTNTGAQCLAAYTPNWGTTWNLDTVRSGFNDFNIDLDYATTTNDSFYCAITNDVTVSNPNLRIFKIALGNFSTGGTWAQFNLTGGADPEFDPELGVDRITGNMAVVYSQTTGGNTDIKYQFSTFGGAYFPGTGADLVNFSHSVLKPRLDCSESQAAYRISYISRGTNDTVVYSSGFTFPFTSRTVVSNNFPGTVTTSPDVIGFRTGVAAYGGGVTFVGGGQLGILYDGSNVTPTGISNIGNEIPSKFSLSQNYPNPFNPNTNINFAVPQNIFVTLKVYDMLGREVATLISTEMTAGTYKVDFDASKMTSGIYFYKLQAGDFTETKKMILVK